MSDELLEANESQHWPLGRARGVRDALAGRLTMRLPKFERALEVQKYTPWVPQEELLRRVKGLRSPRELTCYRKFLTLCRLVAALEARAANRSIAAAPFQPTRKARKPSTRRKLAPVL